MATLNHLLRTAFLLIALSTASCRRDKNDENNLEDAKKSSKEAATLFKQSIEKAGEAARSLEKAGAREAQEALKLAEGAIEEGEAALEESFEEIEEKWNEEKAN